MAEVFTHIDLKCPTCGRKVSANVSHFVPRHIVDCKCGGVCEIRPISQHAGFKTWACDWNCKED